jgi:DNA-binding NtrC family response regulator
MSKKILIVDDDARSAFDLELILRKAGYTVLEIAESVTRAKECIARETPDLVLLDIYLKGPLTGIDLGRELSASNIAFIYLSANFDNNILSKAKTNQPYGFLVKPLRENELLIMLEVALYRHQNSMESKLRQEQVLENSFKTIMSEATEWDSKLLKIGRTLQPYLPFDCLNIIPGGNNQCLLNGITLLRTGSDKFRFAEAVDFPLATEVEEQSKDQYGNCSCVSLKSGIFNGADFQSLAVGCSVRKRLTVGLHLRSMLHYPVLTPDRQMIFLTFYSRENIGFTCDQQKLLSRLHDSLALAIEGALPLRSTERQGSPKKLNTIQILRNNSAIFKDIVGDSHQMMRILDHISIAAPIDTSILILGESGTGKERVAKAIHELSARKDHPLIIINCASLPFHLIESELFGHEKGSFTGATERRKGKFELADKGTIFLDEIGEMPIELQAKLLRVLQEKEIERIGGNASIKVNIRIIAATNRDLEEEVKAGRFRLDLYYRLCVFPIVLPPLRERQDDIENLAMYFLKKFSRKFAKNVTNMTPAVISYLHRSQWPGNIRELENFMERAVLMAKGSLIMAGDAIHQNCKIEETIMVEKSGVLTINENLKGHILSVLKRCNGKISGPDGAANHLGLPASTLHSKMKKLGLKKWA